MYYSGSCKVHCVRSYFVAEIAVLLSYTLTSKIICMPGMCVCCTALIRSNKAKTVLSAVAYSLVRNDHVQDGRVWLRKPGQPNCWGELSER